MIVTPPTDTSTRYYLDMCWNITKVIKARWNVSKTYLHLFKSDVVIMTESLPEYQWVFCVSQQSFRGYKTIPITFGFSSGWYTLGNNHIQINLSAKMSRFCFFTTHLPQAHRIFIKLHEICTTRI